MCTAWACVRVWVVLTDSALTDLLLDSQLPYRVALVRLVSCDLPRGNAASLCSVPSRVQPFRGREEEPCPVCQQRAARHGRVSELLSPRTAGRSRGIAVKQQPIALGKRVCAEVNKQVLCMLAVVCLAWGSCFLFYLMMFQLV
jgi:hypothetical protein